MTTEISLSHRCRVGDVVIVVDSRSAFVGQLADVICRPAEDLGEPWRTAAEISAALQHDWIIQLRARPERVSAYGREFDTNLFLMQDHQLAPLSRRATAVESSLAHAPNQLEEKAYSTAGGAA